MYFQKESKIAFLLIPRTGSTSLGIYLSRIGFTRTVFPDIDIGEQYHLTLNQCVEKYPDLHNCIIYGVFREPLQRFKSSLLYFWQNSIESQKDSSKLNHTFESLYECQSYDDLIEKIFRWELNPTLTGVSRFIFSPQRNWLQSGVRIINYETMVTDILNLTQHLNKNNAQFFKINSTNIPNSFDQLSPKAIEFAKELYKDDYVLLNDLTFSK
jgi:hypothetical protein